MSLRDALLWFSEKPSTRLTDGWAKRCKYAGRLRQKEEKKEGLLAAGETGVMVFPRIDILLSYKLYCKCLHSYTN